VLVAAMDSDRPLLDPSSLRRFLAALAACVALPSIVLAATVIVIDPYYVFGSPDWRGVNVVRPQYETHVIVAKPYQVARMRPEGVAFGSSTAEVGIDPRHQLRRGSDNARRVDADDARHVGRVKSLAQIILISGRIGRPRHASDLRKSPVISRRRDQPTRGQGWIDAGRRLGAFGHPIHQSGEDGAVGVGRRVGVGNQHTGLGRRRHQIKAAAPAIVRGPGIEIAPHIGGQRNIEFQIGANKIQAGMQVPEFGRAEDLRDLGTGLVLQTAVQQAVLALAPRPRSRPSAIDARRPSCRAARVQRVLAGVRRPHATPCPDA